MRLILVKIRTTLSHTLSHTLPDNQRGILRVYLAFRGRDSSVGIASHYGLDGTGIESRWGRDFPRTFIPALGPTQPLIQWLRGLFPGGKAAGAWG